MAKTIGFHVTKSTYGTWLPGDSRGSWSEAWSPKRGYYGPHQFHDADEQRLDMAKGRMRHKPVLLNEKMTISIVRAICGCVERSNGQLLIMAAAIEATHMHLLIVNRGRNIDATAKWIADQTTKAVHRETVHQGPVWTKNCWTHHIDRQEHWEAAVVYIDEHNLRAGRGSRPYPFLAALEIWRGSCQTATNSRGFERTRRQGYQWIQVGPRPMVAALPIPESDISRELNPSSSEG